MFEEPPFKQIMLLFAIPAIAIILWVLILCLSSGCTLSFTNISTHGQSSDVVDEDMSPNNTVNPNLKIKPGLW
jgi:ABC-type sugar transport system permease subunit